MLAGVMLLSLTACGGSGDKKESTSDGGDGADIKVAMVTDSGDITDQSFNQTTYETCKSWSADNDVEFNYYKPESDSDEARNASVDQAVADGANVIVLPGYMFAAAIVDQSEVYPDVKFVALDVSAGDICEKGVGEGYTYNPDDYEVADYYNRQCILLYLSRRTFRIYGRIRSSEAWIQTSWIPRWNVSASCNTFWIWLCTGG